MGESANKERARRDAARPLARRLRLPWDRVEAEELGHAQRESFRQAMIGPKRLHAREGGVEIAARELAVRMAAQGERVEAYNRWDVFTQGGRPSDDSYHGVRIRQIPAPRGVAEAAVYAFLAGLRAVFGRYDIIHYHNIDACALLGLTRLTGKRAIVTVHGLEGRSAARGRVARALTRLRERRVVRLADEIIVVSRNIERYFLETYGRRTVLIPNGVERHECPPADAITAQYGLSHDDFVLYLSRIAPEKGLHYLLEAFGGVRTAKRLVIAGSLDWEDAYCQRIAQMAEKDERVLLVGLVKGREWEELFGNCCLFVLPGEGEDEPMSLLEALSFGKPCLVSDTAAHIEAGRGCVSLFRRGDARDLRDKLQALLNHPRAGNRQAREADMEDWDAVTQKTLAVYRRVLSPNYRPGHRQDCKRHCAARRGKGGGHAG